MVAAVVAVMSVHPTSENLTLEQSAAAAVAQRAMAEAEYAVYADPMMMVLMGFYFLKVPFDMLVGYSYLAMVVLRGLV